MLNLKILHEFILALTVYIGGTLRNMPVTCFKSCAALLLLIVAEAPGCANGFSFYRFQSSNKGTLPAITQRDESKGYPIFPMIASTILSIGLIASPLPAQAANSNAAAQISLENLPPTSVSIQIKDLPVVGNLLSGTYTKVPDGSVDKPSVVIKSPKDKVKAISSLATAGHLEFDVQGILNTHLDVDVAADQAGKATMVVQSGLIPKLPFKNAASLAPSGGRESQWNVVTNMGNGEVYYFNAKTGETQFARPEKI